MKNFLFIHGKHGVLSAYELRSVFGEQVIFQNGELSLIKLEQVDQQLLNKLGGTIKIAEVINDAREELLAIPSNKILFGLSTYGIQESTSSLLRNFKEELKEHKRPCRFMNKDYQNISSGLLNKSNLMKKGVDLVYARVDGEDVWARTVFFQDIDSYSQRDYDKPKRDMKVGMMPPKLIQMMINMAKPNESTTIYDPFCGLGGTAMETLLRGNPAIGSDIKGRLIDSTLKNLDWLRKQFGTAAVDENNFFQHDATQPFGSRELPEDLVVVSEGYLGPPLDKAPDENRQQEIFQLLDGINSSFFAEISKVMSPGKRLVMTLPYFRIRNEQVLYPEEMVQKYEGFGFQMINTRKELLYERKQQVVGREVLVFEKC